MLAALILIAVGVGVFMFGLGLEIEIILIIGGSIVASGILTIFGAIAGYGKSESEKEEINKELRRQYREGMTRRSRYTMFKMTMNDRINEDIKNDISDGINRSSRH